MIGGPTVQRWVRAAFWGAVVFTFVSAELPQPYAPHIDVWDKALHCTCFIVLMLLGAAGYPGKPLLRIAVGLAAFGALIEIVQAIPVIHRDADFWDWVADVLGIAAACTPLGLLRRSALQWSYTEGIVSTTRAPPSSAERSSAIRPS